MPQGIPWMADNSCPYKCGQEFFAFLKVLSFFEGFGGMDLGYCVF